jgi:putative serine/threonine protein kinase
MQLPPRFEELKANYPLTPFAEGYRGLIYLLNIGGEKFAVKTPQEEKLIPTFRKEANILLYLKGKGVRFVPRVEFVGEDYFVYRFIEGKPFKRVQKELSPKELRHFLRKLLTAAFVLDTLGVFKNEFQRPFTNVLINGKKLFLVDFERGQLNKYWKNLPQYLQYLVAVGVLDRDEAIALGKEYKRKPKEVYKGVLKRLF